MWLLEGFQYTVLQFCKYLGVIVFSTRSAISFELRSLASVVTLLHAFFLIVLLLGVLASVRQNEVGLLLIALC